MVPNKGLFTDCNPIDQPPGTWRDAKNLIISKSKGAYANEDGTLEINIPAVVIPERTYVSPNLNTFVQILGDPIEWSLGSTPIFTRSGTFTNDAPLIGQLANILLAGTNITISYNINIAATGIGVLNAFIGVYKDGIITTNIIALSNGDNIGTTTLTSLPSDADHLYIVISGSVTLVVAVLQQLSIPNITIAASTLNTTSIGTAVFPDDSIVVFSAGDISRIGIIDINNSYSDLIVDNALNLSTSFPIRSSEIQYDFFERRIVVWTDRNNPTRILNLDFLPFTLNVDKELVDPTEINLLDTFPTLTDPIFDFTVNQNGGSLLAGAYSYALVYTNIDGTRTPNTTPIKTIYITDDNSSLGYDKFDGAIPGTATSKSITLTISNIDRRYEKLVLIGFSRINNQISAFEIKTVQITASTINVTHIGTEVTTPLSLEEVLAIRPIYTKTGCLAQLNNRLYQGDLESEDDINYQSYANQIKIFYNTKLVNIGDINNSQKNGIPGGFPHGGVCAFYITLKLKNGSYSRAFHIPGSPLTQHSGAISSSTLGSDQSITALQYQIEDTTNQSGTSYTTDGDTIRPISLAGNSNMGYWENQDEEYPIGSDFPVTGSSGSGRRVRHHVFPSLRRCKQLHYSGIVGYGREKIDILGIDVANILFSDDIKSKIEGWAIFYAQRDTVNSNTLGTDLFLCSHTTDNDSNRIAFAGGNWRTDAKQPGGDGDSGTYAEDFNPNPNYIRGHSFQLLKDKPALGSGSLFIDLEFKYTKIQAHDRYQDVGKTGGNVARSGSGNSQDAGGILDITDTVNCTVDIPVSQTIRRIDEFRYLPSNIIDGNIWTMKNEETIHLKVNNGNTVPLVQSVVRINSPDRDSGPLFEDNGISTFPNGGEQGYIMTYKQVKANLFANFDQQLLVATDTIGLPTESSKIKIRGGDTFVSCHSFICSFGRHGGDIGGPDGVSVIRNYICESKYNIGLRYEVPGDVTTKYYPKTQPTNFWTNSGNVDQEGVQMIFDRQSTFPNNYGYSDDFNSVNNLIQPVIYQYGQINTTKFPYRVIRSGFSGTIQNSLSSWKTYLSADFYESNRNRGRIENLVSLEDTLLIHHQHGIFYTLGSQKLSLGATEVFLGTSDIFSQVPKEAVSTKLGYLGNQNIFGSYTYKGNYAWIDQSQGRVFTMSKNGVVEISNSGMYNFFRDNSRIDNTFPSAPIIGESLIGGYDPKYNRLLFTKKSDSNAFTISFSIEDNVWISYHDYIPQLYFNTNNNFYSISDKIYRHNNPLRKAKFYNNTIHPSYITRVFNDAPNIKKILYNLNWITQVYDNSGVLLRNETLNRLQATSSFQDTGEIILVSYQDFNNRGNIRKLRNEWNFNKLKDINSEPLKRRPLMDQYFIVKFQYDNKENLDTTQNSLYLYLLACNFRQSEL